MSFGIWNNLDDIAAYIGLDRLAGETDEEFYNKIKLLAKYRYKPNYYNQIKSISSQLGLQTKQVLKFNQDIDFICKLGWEYFIYQSEDKYIRIYIDTPNSTLQKIITLLEQENIDFTLMASDYKNISCEYLIKNTNIKYSRDYISNKRNNLLHTNIIPGTLSINDKYNFINEVDSLQDLSLKGDYFVDYKNGYLELFDSETAGSYLSYQYYDKSFSLEYSEISFKPVNLITKYGINDNLAHTLEYILDDITWGE